MKSFGQTLKEAREAKGLTPSQLAHETHMLVQTIVEMEREDFHRIPAPIYGRGFVRLYAQRVGLDPAPLITEFMDIYQGRKPPQSAIPAAPVAPPPAPVAPPVPTDVSPVTAIAAEPVPEATPETTPEDSAAEPPSAVSEDDSSATPPVTEIPAAVRGLDLFDPTVPPPAAPPPVVPSWDSPYASAYAEPPKTESPAVFGESAAEKFRQGLSSVSHGVIGRVHEIPRSAYRIALLIALAAATVGLIAWGCMALYRATAPETPAPDATPAVSKPATAPAPSAEKKTPPTSPAEKKTSPARKASAPKSAGLRSTGPAVPPLYID